MKCLADQIFGDVRAVAVGGVEERMAQIVRAAQDLQRRGTVFGLAPDLRAAHAHRSESEPIDGEVADLDLPRCCSEFPVTRVWHVPTIPA